MNRKQKKTFESIFSNPVNGNLEWTLIEALLVAAGCRVIEGSGSSAMFEKDGLRAYFHRRHPGKEALKYRVRLAREYLEEIGMTP
ncbi:MAG: type II toxin-antitoxin system HicA family toxin [Betaproteobacteria bacterium]|nr:type II toxin-antitoxin system HicA family toxin [Betaproteobacteria bacterium]